MDIVKKEILEFSEKETDALQLVTEMCLGIYREASDPNLQTLAKKLYNNLSELWGWEE